MSQLNEVVTARAFVCSGRNITTEEVGGNNPQVGWRGYISSFVRGLVWCETQGQQSKKMVGPLYHCPDASSQEQGGMCSSIAALHSMDLLLPSGSHC